MKISQIRILESEPNGRGDLFGRLMGDLFLSLGYEDARYNVHKSGREIDIEALHRTEARRIVAECKATKKHIGGDEVNKFIGSLDAEKRKSPNIETTGYYISLGGFTETAIEQEKDLENKRVILLDWVNVIEELVKGNIIISLNNALEQAGRCLEIEESNIVLDQECELLAHSLGWIWAIYFTENKKRKSFCLVHADGEVLAAELAEKVIQADKSIGGSLDQLTYIGDKKTVSLSDHALKTTKDGYYKYLIHECGDIKLDGLPADGEIGSRRLNLENIFVPLHVVPAKEYAHHISEQSDDVVTESRELLGEVLNKTNRLTILAGPGGGKSTLLKRLAIAYAFPERRKLIDDKLPDRNLLPLFLRCRQLESSAATSILDILYNIPHRAEISNLSSEFIYLINHALQSGDALLLVDGLDEIADESLRVSFVHQLRVFLAIYPSINIVITSRKAGFRIIGSALISHCSHYELASFDHADIKRLSLLWHKEVIGDKHEIRVEAEKLSNSIIESDRLLRLAQNPLLLTTLLLVKRWVGQLPTRRSVLYGKAIEVLLMTWNVEGHEPLDQEEVIPQLSYVAYAMMVDGVQRISLRRLKELLVASRRQMPEILGFAKISVPQFIERVELRSSLLIQTGHEIENGTIFPFYEFQHLTFQEYLASKAVAEGYYQNQRDDDTLLEILSPYLKDQNWKEVITLSAVLSGRKGHPLVKHLINLVKQTPSRRSRNQVSKTTSPAELLTQCILDEVQISPETLEESLEWISRRKESLDINSLLNSKFADVFEKTILKAYLNSDEDLLELGSVLGEIHLIKTKNSKEQISFEEIVDQFSQLINSNNNDKIAIGLLATMETVFDIATYEKSHVKDETLHNILILLLTHLASDEIKIITPACWALTWYFIRGLPLFNLINESTLSRLIDIWKNSKNDSVEYVSTWAIREFPLKEINLNDRRESKQHENSFYLEKYNSVDLKANTDLFKKRIPEAAIIVAYYYKLSWFKEELINIAKKSVPDSGPSRNFNNLSYLLEKIGPDGKGILARLKELEKKHKVPVTQ